MVDHLTGTGRARRGDDGLAGAGGGGGVEGAGVAVEANRAQAGGTAQKPAWWIISRVRGGRVEAMTVSRGREALLAVFGHEEAAGMFLWSLGPGKAADGWRVAETRSGELASVLYGPCGGADGVAL